MRRSLDKVQAAAPPDWVRLAERPRFYRVSPPSKRKGDWVDAAFKYGLFSWLMWMIWAPVLLGVLVVIVILI